MRSVTLADLTLWTGQSQKPAPCATCGRPTHSRWEEESGLIEIRACCFACAQAEYQRRLSLDHAAGYHDDMPRNGCQLCDEAMAGQRTTEDRASIVRLESNVVSV